MKQAVQDAMAAFVSKLSPSAQLRRRDLGGQLRELALKSLDVSISELRRLNAECEDLSAALAAFCLIRQQVETADVFNAISMSEVLIVADAAKSDKAKENFSAHAKLKKKALEDRMLALAGQYCELIEEELRRLGLETPGQEGRDYTEACALVRAMRQQMQTEDVTDPKISGVLGTLKDLARSAAEDEVRRQAQAN